MLKIQALSRRRMDGPLQAPQLARRLARMHSVFRLLDLALRQSEDQGVWTATPCIGMIRP